MGHLATVNCSKRRRGGLLGDRLAKALTCLLGLAAATVAQAGQVSVAVAANFTAPMTQLAAQFEKATGHQAVLSHGSTGKFYAQIKNGAPFDVLLAADVATVSKLVQEGAGVKTSQFTYAVGRLALWSATPGYVDAKGDVLRLGQFRRLAIASPLVAPYGVAAVQTLERLGLRDATAPKLVTGESIGQTFNMVATGNAELGLVAQSQVLADGKIKSGSAWLVPANLHSPIEQDAVLLQRGAGNVAAAALMAFLKTDKAKAVIASFGYEAPNRN